MVEKAEDVSIKDDGAGRLSLCTEHRDAEMLYSISSGAMSIYHTYTPEQERGNGIAERMAAHAFVMAKRRGLKVRPDCPYMVHFLEEHKELRGMAVES
jgi:hypothetical protein